MGLPAEEPVIKAMKIAIAAKRNGWHGNIDAPEVDGIRHTTITATRNDESITVKYVGNAYQYGSYTMLGKEFNLHCASVALEKVEAWPDILKLFKEYPHHNKPKLVATYRRLPFQHDEPTEELMPKLVGKKIFWYSHEYNRLDFDVPLPIKSSQSKNYRIVPVGHRRLFHFMGAKCGFRSVLLDMIIKVG